MGNIRTHGPSLIAMSYAITPLAAGSDLPLGGAISVKDTQRYGECDVGILTGCGAIPITAIEINTGNEKLRETMNEWCLATLGVVPYRITPQSFTLFYRAATRNQGQRTDMVDRRGNMHSLIAKGSGLATIAFSNDPAETYGHVLGSIASTHASTLRIVSINSIDRAMDYFIAIACASGMKRRFSSQIANNP